MGLKRGVLKQTSNKNFELLNVFLRLKPRIAQGFLGCLDIDKAMI